MVVVLALLAILSTIVISFIVSVSTDLQASKGYAGQVGARLIADSAVHLAIAQIRRASSGTDEGGNLVAWASQPGLIRQYGSDGQLRRAFKLYSAEDMVMSIPFNPAEGGDLPDGSWQDQPNVWVDMNKPILLLAPGGPIAENGQNHIAYYPIVDPNALGEVEGFEINGQASGPSAGENPLKVGNRAAMPVRWLYLLRDGTLLPAVAGTGTSVRVTGASKANPIVGRVAFWTDDETAKLNINTASEGTFWDSPVCNSQPATANSTWTFDPKATYEADLVYRQAAQGEYQRYPGHPATTCLSPVLGSAIRRALGLPLPPNVLTGKDRERFAQAISQLTPRVSDYGKTGTQPVSSLGGTRRPVGVVQSDRDRFYATVDEMVFGASNAANVRPVQQQSKNGADLMSEAKLRETVERSKFFLTTNSRAPEENLFNKPRIALWPLWSKKFEGRRTSLEKHIAFCATVDGVEYAFTREDPSDPAIDWNAENQRIYQYLQKLTERPIPGFGGDFFGKYSTDRDQILTEIFDYVRCTNLRDNSPGATAFTPKGGATSTVGGQVVPLEPNSGPGSGTRGFGRISTISELALVLVKVDGWKTRDEILKATDGAVDVAGPEKKTRIECVLLPELFCPMAGFPALADDIRIKFTRSTLTVDGQDPFSPITAQPNLYQAGRISSSHNGSTKTGSYVGIAGLIENAGGYPIPPPADSVPPNGVITVNGVTGDQIQIVGEVDVEIWAPAQNGKLIQKFTFSFPPRLVPIPDAAGNTAEVTDNPTNKSTANPTNVTFNEKDATFAEHNTDDLDASNDVSRASPAKGSRLVFGGDRLPFVTTSQDTVYSVVASGDEARGDLRLVAGQPSTATIDKAFFQPAEAASLVQFPTSDGIYSSPGVQFGNLVQGITAGRYTDMTGEHVHAPKVPAGAAFDGVKNSQGQPGDWDNGPALMLDGPLLNKADEGVADSDWMPGTTPYLSAWFRYDATLRSPTFFSPNRQVPSPVVFGSLPTGVRRKLPWQTLLFRPAVDYLPGGVSHPGARNQPVNGDPPDHLLLDLFWMPVVEPYLISEVFSTAGKVNLNTQIVPFCAKGFNIKRDTGIRAVMQAVMITALNPDATAGADAFVRTYKTPGVLGDAPGAGTTYGGQGVVTRRPIDLDATLKQFETRFSRNEPFISASEICNIPLVPSGETLSSLKGFWQKHKLTGDNSLERPYALIYPRVTTKSNSYTVHVIAQNLQKNSTTDPSVFDSGKDRVTGEFRGTFLIERSLDPGTAKFDPTSPGATLGPYRFRIVASKQFGQ